MAPTYAGAFTCIGPACEDPCCDTWDIPVDQRTYEVYRRFPQDRLGLEVSAFVQITNPQEPALYATILRSPTGACPFFGADHLCGIQKEYGPELLSATCSLYPRSLTIVDNTLEGALNLSCPEAARNILLNPGFLDLQTNLHASGFRTDNTFQPGPLYNHPQFRGTLPALRTLFVEILRDRRTPLWHRVLLLGTVCERLDAIATSPDAEANANDSVAHILADTRRDLAAGRILPRFGAIAPNPQLALSMAFALSDARVRDQPGARFQDSFLDFVQGISASDPGTPADDAERLMLNRQRYLLPYLDQRPFLLENYLLNAIYLHVFPFGRGGSARFIAHSILDEFLILATQLTWSNTLLSGVAAHYRETFGDEHVIRTLQPLARETDHYPAILDDALARLRQQGAASLEGIASILKL